MEKLLESSDFLLFYMSRLDMPQAILDHGPPATVGNLISGSIKMRKIKGNHLLAILSKHDILLSTAKKL